jgi:hypothetical protein
VTRSSADTRIARADGAGTFNLKETIEMVPHHGGREEHDQEILKRLMDQMEGRAKRAYSEGRVSATDDGDLALAVAADRAKKIVIIDFGKQVDWIGMGPEQAVGLAEMLIAKAREVSDRPLSVNIGGTIRNVR